MPYTVYIQAVCVLWVFSFLFRINAHNQMMWSCVLWSWGLPILVHSGRKWWASWCSESVQELISLLVSHFIPWFPSECQTLVKEAMVHPLESEPGQFLPQTEQNLPPPPADPQTSSQSGQAKISLAISIGPAPIVPSAVTRSTLLPRSPTLDNGMRGREGWREHSGARERWGITKERARGRLSQQKERKATQMLAIVLGETWLFDYV